MKKMIIGAVISALTCGVCAVGLYKTFEPICLIWGCLAFMMFLTCVCGCMEEGGKS